MVISVGRHCIIECSFNLLIVVILQLQTQQLMTSQIRSHVEYLTPMIFSC